MTSVRLKHLCARPPEYGLNITPAQYRDTGVRLLRTSDITADGVVRESGGVCLDSADVPPQLRLHDGDLLFSRSGTIGRAHLYSRGHGGEATFAGFLVRFRLRNGVDPRAIRYWSESAPFQGTVASEAIQSTISNFNAERYGNLVVPEPLVEKSAAIADYLDAETERVDVLVAHRLRIAAAISERLGVLTRDLVAADPDGNLYPRVPLRRKWQVIDCKHRTPNYQPAGYPIVSPGEATPGTLDLSRSTRFVGEADFEDLTEGARRPRRGDVIYTRNASIGIASYVDTDEAFSMGQDVCLIRSDTQDQRFLTYVLNSIGLDQLEQRRIGSTFSRINVSQVMELLIPWPEPSIQRRIADQLDEATESTRATVSAARHQIDLFLERRQAVITAAVTGQLEIAGVAA